MDRIKHAMLVAAATAVTALAPVAPAAAYGTFGPAHAFGFGHGLFGAVFGVATLPLVIASAVISAGVQSQQQAAPYGAANGYAPPSAYAPRPAAVYPAPPIYYAPRPAYYPPAYGYFPPPRPYYAPRNYYAPRPYYSAGPGYHPHGYAYPRR